MPHRIWPRPRRPYLQNGKGITRGMILASCPGWELGFDQPGNHGPTEDRWMNGKRPGSSFTGGSTGGVPTLSSYEHTEEYGNPSLEDGSPNTANVEYDNSGAPGFRFQFAQGLSAFMLVRPEDVGNTDCAVFKCRAGGLGVAQNGWDLRFATGNTFQANICDGATNIGVTGATVCSFGTGPRQNTVVGLTWDRVTLRLWVHGKLDGSVACALNPALVTNTQTPKWFGAGVLNTDIADVSCGMGAVWNRAITQGEINQLYADPFFPWRAAEDELGSVDYQTFLLSF